MIGPGSTVPGTHGPVRSYCLRVPGDLVSAARRAGPSLASGLLACSLLAPLGSPWPALADHAVPPGPVHAGKEFGWWHRDGLVWREEFEPAAPLTWHEVPVEPAGEQWLVRGRGVVQHQYGMLTLNTTRRASLSATLDRPAASQGRWEIRLRSRAFEDLPGAADFQVLTELVPADPAASHCGGRNVALESYPADGSSPAGWHVRAAPDVEYAASLPLELDDQQWHTFAVEVTPRRVVWFVDAHVVRRERRAPAVVPLARTVRFTLQATPGARMNRARMQMDWLRHWSLAARSRLPVRAPRAQERTFDRAC